jgi:hypothetical protein
MPKPNDGPWARAYRPADGHVLVGRVRRQMDLVSASRELTAHEPNEFVGFCKRAPEPNAACCGVNQCRRVYEEEEEKKEGTKKERKRTEVDKSTKDH